MSNLKTPHENIKSIMAYCNRDNDNGNNGKKFLTNHLKKLNYTPEKIIINQNNVMKKFFKNIIEGFSTDKDFENIQDTYQLWLDSEQYIKLKETTKNKEERFNYLSQFLNNSNKDFYDKLTSDELYILGW